MIKCIIIFFLIQSMISLILLITGLTCNLNNVNCITNNYQNGLMTGSGMALFLSTIFNVIIIGKYTIIR